MIENTHIGLWVEEGQDDKEREFRAAVHTILAAIANDSTLSADMVIKGGILLAIRYKSYRYTKDIDFSTSKTQHEINPDELAEKLNSDLIQAAVKLDYDLDCRVQSCRIKPANKPDASFPSVKMKIGYAQKGTIKHRRLLANKSPTTISIDYSLNEVMPNVESIAIGTNEILRAYKLTDLIAEKLRSMLQQKIRDRTRRQDIFDLLLLIEKYPDLDVTEKKELLDSLVKKSKSRGVFPTINSLDDPEIRQRSKAHYHTLSDEIDGDLPAFDRTYNAVNKFYKSLPWS
ncbi:MAG: nucleotidyl transferase AbiEii/AbiGii toxin family protein [Gammaproteobacteria bacterium]|nr:nucleotidyl transferase AbiEii/AbiGii toxin family protein [Gammaproteobacteria bacterium]